MKLQRGDCFLKFRFGIHHYILLLVLNFLVFGCQSRHNFSHIRISNIDSPTIKTDPTSRLSSYGKFAVLPNDESDDPLVEKQVLYLAASSLVGRGYEQVRLNQAPDFYLVVNHSNEYKSSYVPPSTYSVPVYNPGQTYITNTNAWVNTPQGPIYGSAQSTTTTPGYWTSQTYTRPGYTVGWYYPAVSISLIESGSRKAIWSGSNVGSSSNGNFGLTSPFVLSAVTNRLPNNKQSPYIQGMASGELGEVNFFYDMLSRDGSTYYPTVIGVPDKSAAKKAGLKLWDVVIEIKGESTANIEASRLIDLCTGQIGEIVNVRIVRLDKIKDLQWALEPIPIEFREALK